MMSRPAMLKKRKKTRRTAPSELSQRKSRKTTNQVKTSVTAKTLPKIADDDQDVDDPKMNRETKIRTVTSANAATTKMIVDRDVAVGVDTVDAVEAVAVIAEEAAEEEVVADQEDAARTVEAAVEVAMGVRPSLMTPRSKRKRACLKNYIAKKPHKTEKNVFTIQWALATSICYLTKLRKFLIIGLTHLKPRFDRNY
jgi:hypothetical protein